MWEGRNGRWDLAIGRLAKTMEEAIKCALFQNDLKTLLGIEGMVRQPVSNRCR
jgi:hypothetical protein